MISSFKLLARWASIAVLLLPACSPMASPVPPADLPPSASAATSQPNPDPPAANLPPCDLQPVAVPTALAERPGYTELDPATGLHITGKAPEIDLASYRLKVAGKVDRPLSLTYDELRCMPKVEGSPELVCPGFFEDTATWAGVPLKYVLELAGVQEGASGAFLNSADGYFTGISLEEALSTENFLAYEWDGEPLPILHGFPLRAIFPGTPGGKWVKWLVEIEVH